MSNIFDTFHLFSLNNGRTNHHNCEESIKIDATLTGAALQSTYPVSSVRTDQLTSHKPNCVVLSGCIDVVKFVTCQIIWVSCSGTVEVGNFKCSILETEVIHLSTLIGCQWILVKCITDVCTKSAGNNTDLFITTTRYSEPSIQETLGTHRIQRQH